MVFFVKFKCCYYFHTIHYHLASMVFHRNLFWGWLFYQVIIYEVKNKYFRICLIFLLFDFENDKLNLEFRSTPKNIKII